MNIDKNVVCMMPWIHAHIWPEGKVFPCCMSDSRVSFGNTNNNTIDEIINNDNFKNLRLQMLAGEKPSVCKDVMNLRRPRTHGHCERIVLFNFTINIKT